MKQNNEQRDLITTSVLTLSAEEYRGRMVGKICKIGKFLGKLRMYDLYSNISLWKAGKDSIH